ncbi:MAG: M48 family metallopeptidase [Methylomonas sp.]
MNPNTEAPLFYSLRRSQRAKTTRIIVKPGRIEVVAPLKASERRIKAFVEEKQDWIRAAAKRIADRMQAVPCLAPAHYSDGATVPFLGRQIPLQIKQTQGKTVRIQFHDDEVFLVYLPTSVEPHQSSELIRLSLIRWMKQQARLHASTLIEKHAQQLGLFPRSLRIKTQKSRWGSCGPYNDINLNWLLMLAPLPALEYVVVHELCHIRHKNHSRDFWGLVSEHLPDYLQQRRWLKQHGASLMKGL